MALVDHGSSFETRKEAQDKCDQVRKDLKLAFFDRALSGKDDELERKAAHQDPDVDHDRKCARIVAKGDTIEMHRADALLHRKRRRLVRLRRRLGLFLVAAARCFHRRVVGKAHAFFGDAEDFGLPVRRRCRDLNAEPRVQFGAQCCLVEDAGGFLVMKKFMPVDGAPDPVRAQQFVGDQGVGV